MGVRICCFICLFDGYGSISSYLYLTWLWIANWLFKTSITWSIGWAKVQLTWTWIKFFCFSPLGFKFFFYLFKLVWLKLYFSLIFLNYTLSHLEFKLLMFHVNLVNLDHLKKLSQSRLFPSISNFYI